MAETTILSQWKAQFYRSICSVAVSGIVSRVLKNEISAGEFAAQKPKIDSEIADQTNSELVCGLIKPSDQADEVDALRKDQLEDFFASYKDCFVIDVRESHEFAFTQDWSELDRRVSTEHSVDAFERCVPGATTCLSCSATKDSFCLSQRKKESVR